MSIYGQTHKNLMKLTALCGLFSLYSPTAAFAEGKLNIYCSLQSTTCEKVAQVFGQKYDVKTQVVRNSTGTILGKIKSEKENPQADVWFGGTIEPHLQAGDLGLLEKYRSPNQKYIMPQFKEIMDKRGDYTSIIYFVELVLGVNAKKLAELNIAPPKCFADLTDERFKDQIQYTDPRVSGTGYAFLATMVTLYGEDKAFEYFAKLNKNVSHLAKTGMSTHKLATGEVGVNISFMNTYLLEQEKGAPVEGVRPCEGISSTLGATSIIKGARNLENAKRFTDWVLTKEAQELQWRETGAYQLPTNIHAEAYPKATLPQNSHFIKLDVLKFGSDQESKRLINRWVETTLNPQ